MCNVAIFMTASLQNWVKTDPCVRHDILVYFIPVVVKTEMDRLKMFASSLFQQFNILLNYKAAAFMKLREGQDGFSFTLLIFKNVKNAFYHDVISFTKNPLLMP